MEVPDTFIAIPSAGGETYYIRPYAILSLVDSKGGYLVVHHQLGDKVESFRTLLTAQEIHERIKQLEQQTFIFTFGENNASD